MGEALLGGMRPLRATPNLPGMRHELHDGMLILAPVVIAVTVALGDPWLAAQRSGEVPGRDEQTLARACEASVAANGGSAAAQQAEVSRCLRDALRVIRAARAGA